MLRQHLQLWPRHRNCDLVFYGLRARYSWLIDYRAHGQGDLSRGQFSSEQMALDEPEQVRAAPWPRGGVIDLTLVNSIHPGTTETDIRF